MDGRGILNSLKTVARLLAVLGVVMYVPLWFKRPKVDHYTHQFAQLPISVDAVQLMHFEQDPLTLWKRTVPKDFSEKAVFAFPASISEHDLTQKIKSLAERGLSLSSVLFFASDGLFAQASLLDGVKLVRLPFDQSLEHAFETLVLVIPDRLEVDCVILQAFISLMVWARDHQKRVIVIDKGDTVISRSLPSFENQDIQQLCSFASYYGMTTGEALRYYNMHYISDSVGMQVIPVAHSPRSDPSYVFGDSELGLDYADLFTRTIGALKPLVWQHNGEPVIALAHHALSSRQAWHELRLLLQTYGIESQLTNFYDGMGVQHVGLKLTQLPTSMHTCLPALLHTIHFFKKSHVSLSPSSTFFELVCAPIIKNYLDDTLDWNECVHKINRALRQFALNAQIVSVYKPLPEPVIV